jgi:GNAT superfamily N-acetyltransferase
MLQNVQVASGGTPPAGVPGARDFGSIAFSTMSNSVFFKRYRMQMELDAIPSPSATPPAPAGDASKTVEWLPWHPRLVGLHALAKWESFRHEMDGNVFPCLADREGCKQLMRDIVAKANFVPEATWLAIANGGSLSESVVGTIQGLRTGPLIGAIQNIGVVPAWRGHGIGRELIRRSLLGFQEVGCRSVSLEVTVHNSSAIRLYRSIGFERTETVYKYGFVPMQ